MAVDCGQMTIKSFGKKTDSYLRTTKALDRGVQIGSSTKELKS